MLSEFYTFKKLLYLSLFFLCLFAHSARAQTYANSQTNGGTGLCLLCGVSNPDNAVNGNLNDYSTFNISMGLLGVSVHQALNFPAGGTAGCDSLVIGVGSSNGILSLNLVGGVTVATLNGVVPNNDPHVVDSSKFRPWGNNRGETILKPAASFDRVKVSLSSSLIGLLNAFHVYYAYHKPALLSPLLPDSVNLCSGDTASLAAVAPAGTTVRWYNAPAGGGPLYTGATYKVSPVTTTDYYAEAALNECTSTRKKVTVIVHPKPANPVFSVYYAAGGYGCEYPVRTPVTVIVNQCVQQAQTLQKKPLRHTLELFPNPSAGMVRLNIDKLLPGSVLILRNVHGVEVQREVLTGNNFSISPRLSDGIYFIEIRNNRNEVHTGRVVLKR